MPVKGLFDFDGKGHGFLRTTGYLSSANDVSVLPDRVRRFSLRRGDVIAGTCRPPATGEKHPVLVSVDSVSGLTPEKALQRPRFEDLTPLFPDSQLRLELEGDPANVAARIIDLVSPIGRGQRG